MFILDDPKIHVNFVDFIVVDNLVNLIDLVGVDLVDFLGIVDLSILSTSLA